jgi:exodeoxyribonuclease-5
MPWNNDFQFRTQIYPYLGKKGIEALTLKQKMPENNSPYYKLILQEFGPEPTADQNDALHKLSHFLAYSQPDEIFVLKGYAGTGKTTLVAALIKALSKTRIKTLIMAPTGRAAKVLSGFSGQQASTIHRRIYFNKRSEDGSFRFVPAPNLMSETLIIVDEAGLINHQINPENPFERNVLEDLLEFTASGNRCKLILVGDGAQLPPVGQDFSPALSKDFLKQEFGISAITAELKKVVRQKSESGILHNATLIREQLDKKKGPIIFPKLDIEGCTDVVRVNGADLPDELENAYRKYGDDGVMVLCRSNKRTIAFNQQVRTRIRYLEGELAGGDRLMVVKNNYFWCQENDLDGFLANGDIIELVRVRNQDTEQYGLHYCDGLIRMAEYSGNPEIQVKLNTDALLSETTALPQHLSARLYKAVSQAYEGHTDKKERTSAIKKDPWFQALQVKYAWAITTHKAQGGQWPAIFIDQGFLTEDMMDGQFLRWLYTSFTRAIEKVYLVNFSDRFFETEG